MPRSLGLCLVGAMLCCATASMVALAQEENDLTQHGLTAKEVPGALVGPWTPTKVGVIIAAPADHAARRVELAGEYRGLNPGPLSALRDKPPHLATDWVLGDETGEIYVANRPEVELGVRLHPEYTLKKRVIVRGTVRLDKSGVPYIEPDLIRKRLGDRGAFCSLEVMREDELARGTIKFRIILKNDTSHTLELLYPAGFTHDLVVTQQGFEVWRWSRHAGLHQGIGRDNVRTDPSLEQTDRLFLPPDNSRVYVVTWPQVDDAGQPVPLGEYQVQGIISRRIWTYPVTITAGYPERALEALRAKAAAG